MPDKTPLFLNGDRILIEPDEQPDKKKTKSGLIVPLDDDKPVTTGVIIQIGPGVPIDFPCSVGERVIYSPWAGLGVVISGEGYVVLDSMQIIGTIPEEIDADAE